MSRSRAFVEREIVMDQKEDLRAGIQWKALPRSLGAASTVHDRFPEGELAGVFLKLWISNLIE